MALDTWLIYFFAAVGLSLSPGPNGLLALTHGVMHGSRRTLYTIAGGSLGFVLVISLSMFGIGALLQASAQWLIVMKWLGGAYLVWAAVEFITELVIATSAHRVRPWLARWGKQFNRACGGIFIGLGLWLPN